MEVRKVDTICLNDVKTLIRPGEGAHVSIFMPAHHRGGQDPQDPIRLKNLLRTAENKLTARGLRAAEARSMLEPAERLLTDNLFWRSQGDGLALFIEPHQYLYYRLPLYLREEVGVADRYYIKPLVPLVSECGWFYVLSLSRHENRLLQCTNNNSLRIEMNDIPRNMPEALFQATPGNRMQYHVAPPAGGSNFGVTTAIQTGEKSRPNYDKRNVLQYFEQVSKGLSKILNEEKAPMVLSAVDSLHPLYREANTYKSLLPEGIMGNPDGVADETLRQQAWTIVQPYFDILRREAVSEFKKSAGTGQTAAGIQDVIPAAMEGRVGFLFMAEGMQQWGAIGPGSRITVHDPPKPGDDDLMDLAAYQTLDHSGTIYVMRPEEVPGGEPLSAILRY
jgi:hypothetical protein